MKVQVVKYNCKKKSWIVIDDNFKPIKPIAEYLNYLRNTGKSNNTLRSYAFHLKKYWEYINKNNLEWNSPSLLSISNFMGWLKWEEDSIPIGSQVESRSNSTINNMLIAVQGFYEFHSRNSSNMDLDIYKFRKFISKSPKQFLHHIYKRYPKKKNILKLKQTKKIPKTFTRNEIKLLIEKCVLKRDKFLFSLLSETGMRIGQALSLWHEDIQSWDNKIVIHRREDSNCNMISKSKDTYVVHVSKDLMNLYSEYIVEELDDIESSFVFVNIKRGKTGFPLQYITVVKLFNRILEDSGLKGNMHMFRHSHATELVRYGWTSPFVQKRLGHKNVQTTIDTYTHLDDSDLKAAYMDFIKNTSDD